MKLVNKSAALALVLGAAVAGCKSDSDPDGETTEMAIETTAPEPTTPAVTSTAGPVKEAAPAEKDMTHVLAKDEAYFTEMPMAGKKPGGTLKAGTKVVVMMPRGAYSQVLTPEGMRVYTTTAALKPLGG